MQRLPDRLSCGARAPARPLAWVLRVCAARCLIPKGPVLFGITAHRASTGTMHRLWQQSEQREQLRMRNNICVTFRRRCAHSTRTAHPNPQSALRTGRLLSCPQTSAQGQWAGAAEWCAQQSIRANPRRSDLLLPRAQNLLRRHQRPGTGQARVDASPKRILDLPGAVSPASFKDSAGEMRSR